MGHCGTASASHNKMKGSPMLCIGELRLSNNLSGRKFRREGSCEREPSGFPFAFNNPPQRPKLQNKNTKFRFCNFVGSLSKKSKRTFLTS